MKLKPYTRKGYKKQEERSKYKNGDRPTKDDKLETKNANRSIKKAYRMELKRELEQELDKLLYKDGNED